MAGERRLSRVSDDDDNRSMVLAIRKSLRLGRLSPAEVNLLAMLGDRGAVKYLSTVEGTPGSMEGDDPTTALSKDFSVGLRFLIACARVAIQRLENSGESCPEGHLAIKAGDIWLQGANDLAVKIGTKALEYCEARYSSPRHTWEVELASTVASAVASADSLPNNLRYALWLMESWGMDWRTDLSGNFLEDLRSGVLN